MKKIQSEESKNCALDESQMGFAWGKKQGSRREGKAQRDGEIDGRLQTECIIKEGKGFRLIHFPIFYYDPLIK